MKLIVSLLLCSSFANGVKQSYYSQDEAPPFVDQSLVDQTSFSNAVLQIQSPESLAEFETKLKA